ncbi:hypothetical protein [Pseudomonas rubra]|uniref:Uncharacterized protein n=1 Tax=Pseudomonas rubra TaxID=2942627 RepID=A0ABT5PEX2_9PSED|nr:hypothetical protein [Pseudomonas rubra]MDD1016747.1 hypothetical protein [Pseudomonas rubra]MDD1038720.1 hypothetical protein [Pseudomonas rubra]MDD1157227.1 hypothetical protein [Pseudomonas rubra]
MRDEPQRSNASWDAAAYQCHTAQSAQSGIEGRGEGRCHGALQPGQGEGLKRLNAVEHLLQLALRPVMLDEQALQPLNQFRVRALQPGRQALADEVVN